MLNHLLRLVLPQACPASVWAVMARFGRVNGLTELNGNRIHRLEDIITMDASHHTHSNVLFIWLEAAVRFI